MIARTRLAAAILGVLALNIGAFVAPPLAGIGAVLVLAGSWPAFAELRG